MNDIKVGKRYKMSSVDVICIGFTKKGHAKMQTLGMTHGGWPDEGNIKNYDDIIRAFTSKWAGIIKKLRLLTLKEVEDETDNN